MTNEEQNIIIAEACGWVKKTHMIPTWKLQTTTAGGEFRSVPTTVYVKDDKTILPKRLPLYTTDLNACHEMENILCSMEPIFLSAYCERIMNGRYPTAWGDSWCCVHATAAQRAEAFLRTLGKWSE